MVYEDTIEGKYVDLKSCAEDDAEFTLAIRKDPEFTKFLPALDNTIEQQRDWIRYQRQKEGDYFFVVRDKAGQRIGTIGLYDIDGNHAEGGRLAIKGNNPFMAIEAQLLIYRFAYEYLGLEYVDGYILAGNKRAIRFSKSFGDVHMPEETDSRGQTIIRFKNCKENYPDILKRIGSILYREKGSVPS